MRRMGSIIRKWKMRGIRWLGIFWIDTGRVAGSVAFPAMVENVVTVDGQRGISED
jgi:hypothetical protein